MKKIKSVLLLAIIASLMFVSCDKSKVEDPKSGDKTLVLNKTFEWYDVTIDSKLGTITFEDDGNAYPSWSNVTNTWEIDSNNDLIIYTNGHQYVTRFTWNEEENLFNGVRDETSETQDGVISILKEYTPPAIEESYLTENTFEWYDMTIDSKLGTVTFDTDGNAYPSWSNVTNTWEIDSNNDLIIYTNGHQYVTRFTWNEEENLFNGVRDETSETQDGVISILKIEQ